MIKKIFALLTYFLLAACNSDSGDDNPGGGGPGGGPGDPQLERVVIAASEDATFMIGYSELTLPVGVMRSYTATAHYSDSTTEDVTESAVWISSEKDILESFGNGNFRTVNAGESKVAAMFDSKNSNERPLTVIDAEIDTITITPEIVELAKGTTLQFKAFAAFVETDALLDVTKEQLWVSGDKDLLSIDNTGLAAAKHNQGDVTVTAYSVRNGIESKALVTLTHGGEDGSRHAYVTPNQAEMPVGYNLQLDLWVYTIIGGHVDHSTKNEFTDWSSSDSSVASVVDRNADNPGLVAAKAPGLVEITGSFQGAHTSNIIVNHEVLEDIYILPKLPATSGQQFDDELNPHIPVDLNSALSAKGLFTNNFIFDITTQVVWASSNPDVLLINQDGTFETLSLGTVTLSATRGDISKEIIVTVDEAKITDLEVYAESNELQVGDEQNYSATATYNNGFVTDVTDKALWDSSDVIVARFDANPENAGMLEAISVGHTTIRASITIRENGNEEIEESVTLSVIE
ncbi:Ig-like domain-containing protein [Psychromonas aquimarina]|uniref:Ig-like domain-containing protein n=1 Tax=Psychromonas aquimarina TaxID=444919 RepID=UPI00040CF7B3|nr:Ig-like domain-containing protein [Psychromonas aquimarina]